MTFCAAHYCAAFAPQLKQSAYWTQLPRQQSQNSMVEN